MSRPLTCTGLVDEVYQRAIELSATSEARSLRVKLPDHYRPDATAVARNCSA
jgi:hypothetical protein